MITLDPTDPVIAAWLADQAQERREAQARAAKIRERTRKANAEARRRARAAAAIAAGRTPGINGRPRTGTHPRASYWREYIRRSAAARRAAKQESKP